MSEMYDAYLQIHKAGVYKAYQWIEENIPHVLKDLDGAIDWQIQFDHDASKTDAEEYQAYDAYFYGDRSYKVVQDFKYAWLHHIHNNPHHWQYWVLINDDEEEGTVALEMPFEYVIEMICDWWSFSFRSGDLREVFSWYADHEKRMILHKKTRELVDYILDEIKKKLDEINEKLEETVRMAEEIAMSYEPADGDLEHHGIKGQKWGKRNGPPYPLDRMTNARVRMNAEHSFDDKFEDVSKELLAKHPIEKLEELKRIDENQAIQDVRMNVNSPDKGDTKAGRHFNCPNCAASFEMIERGYDVKARVKPDGSNVEDVEKFFKDGKLEPVGTDDFKIPKDWDYDTREEFYWNKQEEAIENVTNTLKKQGDGARGIIVTAWDTYFAGLSSDHVKASAFHAFNYKIEDGQVFYYDMQSHRRHDQEGDTNFGWIYNSDPRDIYAMRTDNLELSEVICKAVYSNKKGDK